MTTNIPGQRGTRLKTVTACAAAAWALTFGPAFAEDKIIVGLITKTNTNPFLVKMKEGGGGESAAGAYGALKAAGKEKDLIIVSVDGGCPGVRNVAAGVIGATAQHTRC
jgi:ABC-type sugar transport system substrate-binding protein